MIVDFHTHVFPAEMRENRDDYLRRDAGFRELYASSKARMATAGELLDSMDRAGIDRSVICGYAWAEADLCRAHNDYLLEEAAKSKGRLIAFCIVQPSDPSARDEIVRCASAGARGLGELRPQRQGYSLLEGEAPSLLAGAARDYGLVLLFHTSEPVGHVYPGKAGLAVDELAAFIATRADISIVAAHWGGGLPFCALIPASRDSLANTYFDTAATPLLYTPQVYARGVELVGAERILFASDFPLIEPEAALSDVQHARLDEDARQLILGGNAARLLGLSDA